MLLEASPGGSAARVAVVLLLAGALVPAAAPALAGHGRVARGAVLVVAAAHLVGGALVVVGVLVDGPGRADALLAAAALVVLAVLCAGWVALARRAPARAAPGGPAAGPLGAVAVSVAPLASPAAWVAAGAAVLTAASAGGDDALVVTAMVLAVLTGAAVVVRARAPRAVAATALATGVACLLLGGAQRLLAYPSPPGPTTPTWAAWFLLALAAAVAAAVRSSAARSSVAGWVAVSGVCAVAAALALPTDAPSLALGGDDARVPALTLVVTLALALAARLRSSAGPTPARTPGSTTEGVLVATWAGAACLAALLALDAVGAGAATSSDALPVPLRAVLAIVGAQALLYGLLAGRTPFRVVGVAVLSGAWWSTVADLAVLGGPDAPVEVWSLPPAALALAVGVATWRPRPALSSWLTLGPGLALGLVPSALWAVTTDAGIDDVLVAGAAGILDAGPRPALVLAGAVVLVLLGVQASWQAPLVIGAAVALVVGLVQLGPYVVELPLWSTTGAAGVLVLVLAVRLEAARRSSARALGWLTALR